MILLNYAHPLTADQSAQVVALLGTAAEVRDVPTHVDRSLPMAEIAAAMADAAGLSPTEWQTTPLLINPPGLAPLALALLAELHGRSGYFLPALNIRPVAGAIPPRYEVAEIVNLHAIREAGRGRR